MPEPPARTMPSIVSNLFNNQRLIETALLIVFFVPLRKLPEPLPQRNLRRKPEIPLEGGGIGIGGGDVAGLHRHELLVGHDKT